MRGFVARSFPPQGLTPLAIACRRDAAGAAGGAGRGAVLLLVLVVIALLTLSAYSFTQLMQAEREAMELTVRRAQARASAESGIEMAKFFASQNKESQYDAGGSYDNAEYFRGKLVLDDMQPHFRARFTLVAPLVEDGQSTGLRYGLEDLSGRINLNALVAWDEEKRGASQNAASQPAAAQGTSNQAAATPRIGRTVLMKLPGMTEQIADAIIDWIDKDEEPEEYGAEAEHYAVLDPPRRPRNGPLATLDELLLVRDVTPTLLYGLDANRNGFIESSEGDPLSLGDVDNSDRSMDRGWSAYLTLYSKESPLQASGEPKINVNQDDLEALHQSVQDVLGDQWARYIVLYRQNTAVTSKPSGNPQPFPDDLDFQKKASTKVATILDLVGGGTQSSASGNNKNSNKNYEASPLSDITGMVGGDLEKIMDALTTDTAPPPGRININQASRAVLEGLVEAALGEGNEQVVDEILSQRVQDPKEADPSMRYPTWLLTQLIVDLTQLKKLMPYVTAGGDVYRVEAVGYYDEGGPASRLEAVIDATNQPIRVVSWRDLSPLGRGYAVELLGVETQ